VREGQLTVAALVGADRQATRGFLELLAECLTDGDTVLLAGPGHDACSAGSWRTVRHNRLVWASQPAQWHGLVVVLDERAVPVGPWADVLARSLGDRSVGAAAARTNIAGGDELLLGVPYRPGEAGVHRRFVRERAGRRDVTDARHLDGPSLAVRLDDFEAAGGLGVLGEANPVAELARRFSGGKGRLVVAEGAYLHHSGGPGPRASTPGTRRLEPPFVSACLIVKDERDTLPRCLRSLGGFADDVVVYDTGSSDGTPEVAREHGATVIEGFWDGDFARARNAALEHCRGQWILWIDADEELDCPDREASRTRLATMTATAEGLIVQVDNVRANAASTALAHPACRLFRRACAHWTGRIHEQVRARSGSPEIQTVFAEDVRITHWGYLRNTVEAREKGRRNVRSALSELVGGASVSPETALVNLARSYALSGQPEESVDLCRAVLGGEPEAHVRRLALRTLADSLLAAGRPAEALAEVESLRRVTAAPVMADIVEGRTLLALGRPAEALAAFDRVGSGLDDDGFEHGTHDVAVHRATCSALLGRHGDAADALLQCLRDKGGMDAPVATLLEYLTRAGRSPAEVVAAVPPGRSVAFLGQLVHAEPATADAVLEAWHARAPSLAVLATATKLAPSLGLDRQLVWSGRLRQQGLGHACPLVSTAADPRRPLATRLLGASLAAHAWGDPRGRQATAALAAMSDHESHPLLAASVASVAPTMSPVVDGVAPSPPPARVQPSPMPMPPPSHPASSWPSRKVLVVERQPGSIRAMAVAAVLHRSGHAVTVLWPGDATVQGGVMAAADVTAKVWGVQAASVGDAPWQRFCADAVARAMAAEPFDTVVLAPSARDAQPMVRALAPCARIVVDLDDGGAGAVDLDDGGAGVVDLDDGGAGAGGVDLILTSGTASVRSALPTEHPVAVVSASAQTLYARPPATPWAVRTGVCVVGDFSVADERALCHWERTVGPALAERLGAGDHGPLPVCVVGSDPQGRIAGPFPGALTVGPTEDPTPWMRAARVVVVVVEAGSRHWLSAADLVGTPAIVIPATDGSGQDPEHSLGRLVRRICALADPELADPELAGPGSADPELAGPAPRSPEAEGGRPRSAVPGDPLAGLGPLRSGPRDRGVEVRTGIPPDLSPKRADHLAVDLRWGYEPVPWEWIGPLRDLADEVWVPTSWSAGVLVGSGVPSRRVHVVPPGVDVERFGPDRRPYPLRSGKAVTFLFLGDCDEASGVDALLGAYLTAFTGADDVCLVVRPTGRGPQTFEPDVRRAATAGPGRPAVEVVDGRLTGDELAGLFRACDVLVHPHRATGSPDSVLAAMASGRPVVTLDAGAAAAVCDGRTGWLVPCRPVRAAAPPVPLLPSNEMVQLEPSRTGLAEALRDVVASTDRRIRKGLAARDRAVSSYSLERRAAVVAARVEAMGAEGEPAVA
jgi:glycosyltransferase involved in cell wall biosynthesis/tetratricopeptide (TPR) repeat protein